MALQPQGQQGQQQRGPRENARLGLPDGFKVYSPYPFGGIDQNATRTSMADHDFFWLSNFVRLGNGNLRTIWDVGPTVFSATAMTTIVSFFFYNIGNDNNLVAIFLSDGTAYQYSIDLNVATPISTTPGTFYQSGAPLPACCQWGTQYLLIANNFTANGYWVWDGTLLYSGGGLSPSITLTSGGSNYTSTPTVTAVGGSGTGAVLSAQVVNGSVATVNVVNPGTGYMPGDVVQLVFSGGGSDTDAQLQAVLTPGGAVSNAIITAGGSGYTDGTVAGVILTAGGSGYSTGTYSLSITGGGGSGATGYYEVFSGAVVIVALTSVGSGYTSAPTIGFPLGGGTAAAATAVLGTGTQTYALAFAGGGGGTGAAGTYEVSGGAVTAVTITAGGQGYMATPTISFPGGGGSGATGLAIVSAGSIVTAVNIINGGSGYTGTPNLTFQGGGGSDATADCTVVGGAITSVTVLTGGFGYTTPPAVIVSAGENNAASGTIDLMPIGVSGTMLETFQSRVWIGVPFQSGTVSNGGTFLVSAPDSYVDFATSDGGLIFVNSDSFLRGAYVNIKQTNGYLYPMGDSSVSIISNVQTAVPTGATNPTTTFNYQNTDPQIGCGWRDTVQPFGRALIFANHDGVFGLYGGAVTKLSDKIDNLIDSAVFPATSGNIPIPGSLVPSSAVTYIHERKFYLLLAMVTNPAFGGVGPRLLAWDGREWFTFTQTPSLTYIATQEVASNILAWGTDGKNLFQLFAQPSATLAKRAITKLYGAQDMFITKMAYSFYTQLSDYSNPPVGITLSVTIDNEDVSNTYPIPAPPTLLNAAPSAPNVTPPQVVYGARSGDVVGQMLGCDIESTSPDFVVSQIVLGYYDQAALA